MIDSVFDWFVIGAGIGIGLVMAWSIVKGRIR